MADEVGQEVGWDIGREAGRKERQERSEAGMGESKGGMQSR